MKKLLMIMLLASCATKPPKTTLNVCEEFCNEYGQSNSEVLQMSYGVCVCNNSEGRKAIQAYQQFINNKCETKPKDEQP